jgi:hypothetical protein
MVRTHTFTMLTSRLVIMVLFAALLSAAPFHAALAQNLGTADRFAVLGGPAVTLTDSFVKGDVGVDIGTAVTLTRSTILGTIHAGDPVAQQAYDDFLAAYTALGLVHCDQTIDGNLAGQVLTPGVYCVAGLSATTGGVLTLQGSSTDTWIFKIGIPDSAAYLEATNFTVKMSSGDTCSNNVYWWVADYATLTDSYFIGSILAGKAITVTRGRLDGQALAQAAVTVTGANVAVCGTFEPPFPPFPPHPAIKVTGGGQIPVLYPDSTGRATFGFNAQPDKKGGAKGNLNYVNHVTGLHVNGAVTSIQVIAVNPDGSPKTVLFSGTWEGGFFFVTVEDHGEPGWNDQFGITVTTATGGLIELTEVTSQRVISNGNIQFHK